VETYDLDEAARRSGCEPSTLREFVDLGILTPDADDRFTTGHLRRVGLVTSLVASGIPLEGLGDAMRNGQVSLDFLDAPAFDRFSALSGVTFSELAERTGLPVEMLQFIREASGSMTPEPDDRVREEELPYAELIELAVGAGFATESIQRMLRVHGDSLRRLAETETAMWQTEVIEPAMRRGARADEVLGADLGDRMSVLTERCVLAMYHLQQTRAWTGSIVTGVEMQLAAAGLHSRLEHPPAMCFLDITGYTRLTQERGDAAAADLAERLGRIVHRASVQHGGRPVKWLGDGVMLHFPQPGHGVVGALDMVVAIAEAGLPPAHVGLHAGSVIFQEGDYYGQTVNVASRIADFARPGEVLVSQEVVDASDVEEVVFREVGPVELKGVSGTMRLHVAARGGDER
jgi:adenylate cyclase